MKTFKQYIKEDLDKKVKQVKKSTKTSTGEDTVDESWKNILASGLIAASTLSGLPTSAEAKPAKHSITKKHTMTQTETFDWDKLIKALHKQESSGRLGKIIGDNGKAHGPFQVHQVALDDVNKYYGTKYTLTDMYDYDKSVDVVKKYVSLWVKRKKYPLTFENASKIWNGGPNGPVRRFANGYWASVYKKLRTIV